ncbi:hypothetical protein Q9L42_019470 [Methylomarinum sp. Ch1-1]|uniref:Plasmid pRiA4b Orf3-like domain-containing protein n=1 Tax=Methylomarinum roseum TaxID=3067653 RepID=A0AAU7NU62_9GAMM|nr:hypothetical protein [Methylomarinum sp. Ch1-1]MDP4519421.1 hypothetical protein [Methylomarinum sp. Ch1-1]
MDSNLVINVDLNTLKLQRFALDQPGSLLHDFAVLLDFVSAGIEVSAKTHLLPQKALLEINQRLANPMTVKLKRPQQKSFPYINGLFLILRSSGLTRVINAGPKPRLILDEKVLANWHSLTAIEQYFSLLNAWFLRGSPEILGDRPGIWECHYYLFKCLEFFKRMPAEGIDVTATKDGFDHLKYYPELHNLALMDLFGLVTIEIDPSLEQNWPVSKIIPTQWGQFITEYYRTRTLRNLEQEEEQGPFTLAWDSELQSVFPELKRQLAEPVSEGMLNATIVFKVVLHKAYRLIQVSGSTILDDFASAILDAFDFDHDHLYQFSFKNVYGYSEHISHPMMTDVAKITVECRVGELPLMQGMEIVFTFDFGDNWEFSCVVESILDQPCDQKPKVLKKQGKPPKQYAFDY